MDKLTFEKQFSSYVNAGYPFLWIITHEERRIITEIISIYAKVGAHKNTYGIQEWDIVRGLGVIDLKTKRTSYNNADKNTPKAFLEYIDTDKNPSNQILLVKDFHPYLENAGLVRHLRTLSARLKSKNNIFVFISPVVKLPVELEKEVQVLEYALPNKEAIEERLNFIKKSSENTNGCTFQLKDDIKFKAIEAAQGLTDSEIENAFALALGQNKQFNDGFIQTVFNEKVQQVKKNSLLTYLQPDVTFNDIGGLSGLKSWFKLRAKAYEPEAREYGLVYPKGVMLNGIPGVGKSIIGKAAANEMKMPLFQLDISNLFSSLVGSTEKNFRSVLQTVDSIGRCILYIDNLICRCKILLNAKNSL